MMSEQKQLIFPTSVSGANFNPQNTQERGLISFHKQAHRFGSNLFDWEDLNYFYTFAADSSVFKQALTYDTIYLNNSRAKMKVGSSEQNSGTTIMSALLKTGLMVLDRTINPDAPGQRHVSREPGPVVTAHLF